MRTKTVIDVLYNAILNKDDLMLVGDPGVGKSNIAEQVYARVKDEIENDKIPCPIWIKKKEVKILYIHAVVSDPTDPKGMPWVVVSADTREAEARFIPFGDLKEMIEAEGMLIVLLDDFGQAPPLVQAGFMQIILARRINGHVMAGGVVFIACTNKRGGNTGVQGILEPMKDRFLSLITVEAYWQDWCEWAVTSGRIIPEVIAYHRWCGTNDKEHNHLSNFNPTKDMSRSPSPRAWEFISKTIVHKYPQEALREMFCGTVGEAEGNAFHTFLKQYRDLVHPDLIIASPETADIPVNPSVLWSVLTALVGRVNDKNFYPICRYANRLGSEWSTFLMTDCIRKNSALKKTKGYIEWALAHGETQI